MAKNDERLPVHVTTRFLSQESDDDARECVAEVAHCSGAHLVQILELNLVAIVRDAAGTAIGIGQTSPHLARKSQCIRYLLLFVIDLRLQALHFAVLVVATLPNFVQVL